MGTHKLAGWMQSSRPSSSSQEAHFIAGTYRCAGTGIRENPAHVAPSHTFPFFKDCGRIALHIWRKFSLILAPQESCRQNLERASFADLQFFLLRAGDTGGLSYFCARQPRASHRGHSADHKMVISKYLLHCVVEMVKNNT